MLRPWSKPLLLFFLLLIAPTSHAETPRGVAAQAPTPPQQSRIADVTADLALPGTGPIPRPRSTPQAEAGPLDAAETEKLLRSLDTVGGDDRLLSISTDYRYSMDVEVGSDGTVFVAAEYYSPVNGYGIRVFRSTDGGDSFSTWAEIHTGSIHLGYSQVDLLLAEGTVDRLFVAARYLDGSMYDLKVLWADPSAPTGTFTLTHPDFPDIYDWGHPAIATDAEAFGDYYLYLVAEADDGNGNDIWFCRSTDKGTTWETPYALTNMTAGDRDYAYPRVAYGYGHVVHVAWQLSHRTDAWDACLRYKRALDYANDPATDWQGMVTVTSHVDGFDDRTPDVAASIAANTVLMVPSRVQAELHYTMPAPVFISPDQGATWETTDPPTVGDLARPRLGCTGSSRWWIVGDAYLYAAVIYTAPFADPTSWSQEQIFSDLPVSDHFVVGTGADGCVGAHDGQVAVAWASHWLSEPDSLWFDAEWRDDPGYPNLEDGYPRTLPAPPRTPPVLADVDGDPELEIVFATDGLAHVLDPDGTALPGWPAPMGPLTSTGKARTICVGDLDGDGRNEVVAGDDDGRVWCWDGGGHVAEGFPVNLSTARRTFVTLGQLGGPYPAYILALNGSQMWMLDWHGHNASFQWPITFGDVLDFPASVGDVDADGVNEVVTTKGSYVHVHHKDDRTLEMWRNFGLDFIDSPPTLADLDLDGDLEILFTTESRKIYAIHHDGTDVEGWPVTGLSQGLPHGVSCANILGGFEPEVLVNEAMDRVRGFSFTGAELPYSPYDGLPADQALGGPPTTECVDRTAPNLHVTGSEGYGLGWQNVNPVPAGWPRALPSGGGFPPSLADIDQDGGVEVVWLTEGHLTVAGVNHPPDDYPHWNWPMAHHDAMGTRCYNCPQVVLTGGPALQAGRVLFAPPRPNPASGSVLFAWELPGEAVVDLTIYDARGRRVRTLRRSPEGPGPGELRWDLRDGRGSPLAAGIYYALLKVQGPGLHEEQVRKVVHLR